MLVLFGMVVLVVCLGWLGLLVVSAYRPASLAWVNGIRWRMTREAQVRLARSLSLALCVPGALFLFSYGMMTAFAGPFDAFQGLFDAGWILLLVGIFIALIGWVLRQYGGEPGEAASVPALVVGMIALVVGLAAIGVGFLNASIGGGTQSCPAGQVRDPVSGECVDQTNYVADWNCQFVTLASGGPGGAHDAATEFPDSPFIASDGGTPDYDATIATPVYTGGRLARIDINVDDEALNIPGTGTNGNTWLNEETYAFDVNCKLLNPPQAIGGGLATVPLWAQWEVPYMFGQAGNSTDDQVYVCDSSNGGVYLGFGAVIDSGQAPNGHDADHTYMSYKYDTSCGSLPTVGDWMAVGNSSTSAPGNGQYVDGWFNLAAGIISYEDTTTTYSMTLRIGTSPEQSQWRGNIETLRVDIIATDD
jgi:hypothetical protein